MYHRIISGEADPQNLLRLSQMQDWMRCSRASTNTSLFILVVRPPWRGGKTLGLKRVKKLNKMGPYYGVTWGHENNWPKING